MMQPYVPFCGWRKAVLWLCAAGAFLLGILGYAPGLAPTPVLLRVLLLADALCFVVLLQTRKPGMLTAIVLLSIAATCFELFTAFLSGAYAGIMRQISPIIRILLALLPLIFPIAANLALAHAPHVEPPESKS